MDMNDILDQWDKIQKTETKKKKDALKVQVSHKKANAPTAEEKAAAVELKFEHQLKAQNEQRVNPMDMWLRRYGVVDKDKIEEETYERTKEHDRSYLLNMRPQARIDLHGLHQDEAEIYLNNFITECQRKGLKKVIIVHGKGNHTKGSDPVLGTLVKKFIERDKRCGTSGHPKTNYEGGTGATWVILK